MTLNLSYDCKLSKHIIKFSLMIILIVPFKSIAWAELTAICIEHYIRAGAVPQGPNVTWNVMFGKCKIPASTANYGGLGSPRCGNRSDQIEEYCGKSCPSTATPEAIEACFNPPVNPFQEDKSKGPSCGEGNPCDPGSGNKYQRETDYASHHSSLTLERFYNSTNPQDGSFGFGWTSTGLSSLDIVSDAEIKISSANGRGETFTFVNDTWQGDSDSRLQLEKTSLNYTVTYQDTRVETFSLSGQLTQQSDRTGRVTHYSYDASDRLSTITSPFGRALGFNYDSNNRVQSVTNPDGATTYQYSASGNLISVTYPDNTSKTYHYEDTNFEHHLTGITDENDKRFATWTYNSDGKASSSEHAGGAEKVTLSYDTAQNQTTVTGALGDTRTYNFELLQGIYKTTSITGDECRTCGNGHMQTRTYDTNGFLNSYTDWKGNKTTIENNSRGLPTSRTEAVGTDQERTTTTLWHDSFHLPLSITESGKETTFTYGDSGQLLSRTITDLSTNESRTTSYTYHPVGSNGVGLVATVDGPRTDVNDLTTYDYDVQDNLTGITNALGHTTQITSHDASGRPLEITDANGTQTTLTWDLRGRLTQSTFDGRTTDYTYDLVGQLIRVTQADDSYLEYTYDDAHRLTGISDNLGNKIKYVLDKMGNRTSTSTTDINGTIATSQTAIYDRLSRLQKSLGANSQQQTYEYDENHNPLTRTDALTRQNQSNYDALDRLIKSIDPETEETNFEYDAQDNLTKVTDAKDLETTYIHNGFDEVTSQTSPDTGVTSYTYDKTGNRVSMMDARGVTVNYTYDALNRLTSIDYTDNNLDVSHSYDIGENGIGRLGKTIDASGTTTYHYDERGNLLSKIQLSGTKSYTTTYRYNSAHRLSGMTYPSGTTLQYQRLANGEISQVTATINGVVQTILSNASYQPFGPLKSFTYGNALEYVARFDASSRLTEQTTTGIQDNAYSYDTVNNMLVFNNLLDATRNQQFNYDNNDRLTSADGHYGLFQYVFDVVGNRLQKSSGNNTNDYGYAGQSHHLQTITGQNPASYQYDAAGNTLDNGRYQFAYGEDNRLHQVTDNGTDVATYTYNSLGQRSHKLSGNPAPQPPPTEPQIKTLYENAEDGGTASWDIYDKTPEGAALTNVLDTDLNSQVIQITSTDRQNGFRLGHNNANHARAWGNTTEKVISWDAKFSEPVSVFIATQTTLGFRYMYYTDRNSDLGIRGKNNNYIHNGIGTNLRDGQWHTINRDLEADLQKFEPDNQILSVNGFLIRGSGRLDNIALLKNLPPVPPPLAEINYEDAENGDSVGWDIYDQDPAGAALNNVFDADSNSQVIEIISTDRQNGFRLGHNNVNHFKAWNDKDHKTISWDAKFSEPVSVFVATQTTLGFRYLYYTDRNGDLGIRGRNNNYIHHGLGTQLRDGAWHTISRNLETDLQNFEPDNQIVSVNGFLVRGSGRLDNIIMSGLSLAESDTDYIYDQQGQLISEISNDKAKEYIHFNNQPFAIIEGGQVYYYHNNHLGTPETITDQNQGVVWKASHTPYGEATITKEAIINNIRLPGQYFDHESGLHYNYFRYYEPSTGRYVTSDPIGLEGGINTYAYGLANPTKFVDPLGLDVVGDWWIKPFPEVSNVSHPWGSVYRPPYMSPQLIPPAWTAMNIPMTGDVQIKWKVQCSDTDTGLGWNIDAATPPFQMTVDLPLKIGMHPRLQSYVTLRNLTEALVKPATSEILHKASDLSETIFNQMSATAICNSHCSK